jgi:hypothetical protein
VHFFCTGYHREAAIGSGPRHFIFPIVKRPPLAHALPNQCACNRLTILANSLKVGRQCIASNHEMTRYRSANIGRPQSGFEMMGQDLGFLVNCIGAEIGVVAEHPVSRTRLGLLRNHRLLKFDEAVQCFSLRKMRCANRVATPERAPDTQKKPSCSHSSARMYRPDWAIRLACHMQRHGTPSKRA